MLVQFFKDEKGEVHYVGYPSPSIPSHAGGSTTCKSVSEATVGATNLSCEEEEVERLRHLKCSLRNEDTKFKSFDIPFDGK